MAQFLAFFEQFRSFEAIVRTEEKIGEIQPVFSLQLAKQTVQRLHQAAGRFRCVLRFCRQAKPRREKSAIQTHAAERYPKAVNPAFRLAAEIFGEKRPDGFLAEPLLENTVVHDDRRLCPRPRGLTFAS